MPIVKQIFTLYKYGIRGVIVELALWLFLLLVLVQVIKRIIERYNQPAKNVVGKFRRKYVELLPIVLILGVIIYLLATK